MKSHSTKNIIELRKITGAGVSDCLEALENSHGDIKKAITYLRKKGALKAEKKAERETREGIIETAISEDSTCGSIVRVHCESDFVSKNSEFIQFVKNIAKLGLEKNPEKEFLKLKDKIILKIGENIIFGKSGKLTGAYVSSYIHPNKKIGCLVSFNNIIDTETAHDIAMHIAAANPSSLSKNGVPKNIIERELEIYKVQLKKEKKPENLIDKIAVQKLEKFFKENCLLLQSFIKDETVTVEKYLEKKSGGNVNISGFIRFSIASL